MESIGDLLGELARQQKVVILMLKGGDRHNVKLLEVRGNLVIGEARCLYHSYDIGKKIHEHALTQEQSVSEGLPQGAVGLTMADAISRFGAESHRYRIYVNLNDVHTVAEDVEDIFDETPFFSSLL